MTTPDQAAKAFIAAKEALEAAEAAKKEAESQLKLAYAQSGIDMTVVDGIKVTISESSRSSYDADILAGGIDQAHFARINAVVDPVSFFLLRGGGSAAYRRPPGWHWQVVFSSCVRGAFSKHPLGFGCDRFRH